MKPTLIFLHGGPGFEDYLRPYFEESSERFDCRFYNQLRGPQVSIAAMISQLDEVVNSVPGQRILVGHSWGAVLATEYALGAQDKLKGLVLISTGLNFTHWGKEYHDELAARGLLEASPEDIFLTSAEQQVGSFFLERVQQTFSRETFDSLTSYLQNYDLTSTLSSIKLPIANIFGEKDVRFPSRVARSFRSFNEEIVDIEIPGAGHFPFLLKPGRDRIIHAIESIFLA